MVGFFIFFSKPFRSHKMVIYSARFDRIENLKLFSYLTYFFFNNQQCRKYFSKNKNGVKLRDGIKTLLRKMMIL